MSGGFEGLYFKQQAGQEVIAFIPAVHWSADGRRSGSLQVVLRDRAFYIDLPEESVILDRRTLTGKAGGCVFSPKSITVNIRTPELTAVGYLDFGALLKPRHDIMGPFKLVPHMECRHSLISLAHTVHGNLTVNDAQMNFADGIGYIEGDRGRAFPDWYIWTQCSCPRSEPRSLMLSVASIRFLGLSMPGIIGSVWFKGRELRFATYCGAKILAIGDGSITVHQGRYTLTAKYLSGGGQALHAPVSGEMTRMIKENLACRARYILTENSAVLFDFVSDMASFEYEC